jgi:hypothetical protein
MKAARVDNLILAGSTSFYEGAGSRIRTDDLLITNQLLYQLSYAGVYIPQTTAVCKTRPPIAYL